MGQAGIVGSLGHILLGTALFVKNIASLAELIPKGLLVFQGDRPHLFPSGMQALQILANGGGPVLARNRLNLGNQSLFNLFVVLVVQIAKLLAQAQIVVKTVDKEAVGCIQVAGLVIGYVANVLPAVIDALELVVGLSRGQIVALGELFDLVEQGLFEIQIHRHLVGQIGLPCTSALLEFIECLVEGFAARLLVMKVNGVATFFDEAL